MASLEPRHLACDTVAQELALIHLRLHVTFIVDLDLATTSSAFYMRAAEIVISTVNSPLKHHASCSLHPVSLLRPNLRGEQLRETKRRKDEKRETHGERLEEEKMRNPK